MSIRLDRDKKIKIKRNLKPKENFGIYLKNEDEISKSYANGKMKSGRVFEITSGRRSEMMEMRKIGRREKITEDLFYECLDIYNNNQIVLKSLRMTKANIRDILKLEDWFSLIPEPKDKYDRSGWERRETIRIEEGISYYCDENLRDIILKERSVR